MPILKDKLIVALDVPTLEEASSLVEMLSPQVKIFKVGNQLFTACGQETIKMIGKKGGKVFLDLKFYDIPRTVYSAVASGTSSSIVFEAIPTGLDEIPIKDQVEKATIFPVFMMTVHIQGGIEMLKQAVEGATIKAKELNIDKPLIVGVTVLTSRIATEEEVLEAAETAKVAGLDGVVCSAQEAKQIRKRFGEKFIIVTPGIRPKGFSKDDQKRIATAKEAIEAGANYIVVGSPIIKSEDPLATTESIINEIKEATSLKEVSFHIFAPKAKEVYVAGDFNNWRIDAVNKMRRDRSGKWVVSLNLNPGKYHYQFFIDGKWRKDPDNPKRETDSKGKTSSLLELRNS